MGRTLATAFSAVRRRSPVSVSGGRSTSNAASSTSDTSSWPPCSARLPPRRARAIGEEGNSAALVPEEAVEPNPLALLMRVRRVAPLPVKLLSRIDRFIEAQGVPPSVTAVMETVLNALLDKHLPEAEPEPPVQPGSRRRV